MQRRTRQHLIYKPLTSRERLQLYNELRHCEQHGCFSKDASLRIRMHARRTLKMSGSAENAIECLSRRINRDMIAEAEAQQ